MLKTLPLLPQLDSNTQTIAIKLVYKQPTHSGTVSVQIIQTELLKGLFDATYSTRTSHTKRNYCR